MIGPTGWNLITGLDSEDFPVFKGLVNSINKNKLTWATFSQSLSLLSGEEIIEKPLPDEWEEKLNFF